MPTRTPRRLIIVLILAAILIGGALLALSREETPPPQANLEATTDKATYALGDPITVTAVLSALQGMSVYHFVLAVPITDLEVSIIDDHGQYISYSFSCRVCSLGPTLTSQVVPSGRFSLYKPYTRSFDILPWYQLSKPGTYTITLEKAVIHKKCLGPSDFYIPPALSSSPPIREWRNTCFSDIPLSDTVVITITP